MIWKWLKTRILKMADSEAKDSKVDETTKQQDKGASLPNNGKPKIPMSLIDQQRMTQTRRKFELEVFDEDLKDDGSVELKPVKYERAIIVEAATPQDLKGILNQYRMCGQIAKVVREIDPPPPPPPGSIQQAASSQQQAQANGHPSFQAPGSQYASAPVVPQMPVQAAILKPKPKIITIGDMQVKYDGDKVYQKQWVKLNANEAANFRVVNDASNKIVSLNGKHIEAKKWVLVEETTEDSTDAAVEEILAGN